ncbi:MAG: NADH-quinone oxidoreductase subunit L [Sporocytophaga sp.]|uniref:NADH-quinone oxidoreductase subunit L n=1 Tax=Sporocytophaga sp. TaxID=2231183 RepID=UPI001B18AD62|nr:NADH-quinone oxidoreductase subunit L [Sporocytophaga sp.]MBO9699149.1 NADH-quinone oxidoreductase subunit L [Sporocytophaga sp.]
MNSYLITDLDNLVYFSLIAALLPLSAFFILFFFGKKLPRKGDWLATLLIGLSFILSLLVFFSVWEGRAGSMTFQWIALSGIPENAFSISVSIDKLSSFMILTVCLISLLVHLYSMEYMKGKLNYTRYFPYLSIFTFAMLGLVISDNLLITFMFWELVGFTSYLLIGFWFTKEEAVKASKKAFLFNRIGDLGFLLALMIIWSFAGTFEFQYLGDSFEDQSIWFTLAGLGLVLACIGKSAQFPLYVWLPDAMEGPTPVSALIHAATMVAAGIFLLAKVFFLLSEDVLTTIATIGAITMLMSAIPALFQNDIKKVLAYSTISQLGYMFVGIGAGVPEAALFHLFTHAFFKAGLFLSAGAVIHYMHEIKHVLFHEGVYNDFDAQDMRLMGGLRKRVPLVFIVFIVCSSSLVGLPLLSGFLSKEAVIGAAFNWADSYSNTNNSFVYYLIPLSCFVTAFFTALYMIRQLMMVFFGDFRLENLIPYLNAKHEHHHQSLLISLPLVVLCVLSFALPFSLNPFSPQSSWFLKEFNQLFESNLEFAHWVTYTTVLLALAGIVLGIFTYRNKVYISDKAEKSDVLELFGHNWYLEKFYYKAMVLPGFRLAFYTTKIDYLIDRLIEGTAIAYVVLSHIVAWFDKNIIDGIVRLMATLAVFISGFFKNLQSGKVQQYFVYTLATVMILIYIFFNWMK